MSKIEPTPQVEVSRLKQAAKHLQDNPLWQEALEIMEQEYIEIWMRTDPVQVTQRENAYHMVQAVKKLGQQIQTFAQAGSLQRTSRDNVQK